MNVLIIDDHPVMLEYLASAVARAFEGASVRTAPDLDSAFESIRDWPVQLATVDLGLPGCGGIESLLRLREAFPDVRVVVVSSEDDQRTIRGALAAGAAGFIPKSSNPKVMVSALKLVAEGRTYVPPQALADDAAEPLHAGVNTRQGK